LNEAPRVHHAARRRGGVAARGARAAGKATKYRLPEQPGQCVPTILATACVGLKSNVASVIFPHTPAHFGASCSHSYEFSERLSASQKRSERATQQNEGPPQA